jgi:hypothetical protein
VLALYSSPSLAIHLLQQGPRLALEVTWRNQASGQELQEGSIQALLLARRHRVNAWLSDDQALGPLSPADAQWAATMLHSLQHDLAVTRFALLESEDARNRRLLHPLVAQFSGSDSPLQLQRFASLAQARAWVLG